MSTQPIAPPNDPLMKLPEAAQMISMCRRSVENFIAAKAISIVRMGSSIRIRRSEMERFIASRTISAESPDYQAQ